MLSRALGPTAAARSTWALKLTFMGNRERKRVTLLLLFLPPTPRKTEREGRRERGLLQSRKARLPEGRERPDSGLPTRTLCLHFAPLVQFKLD